MAFHSCAINAPNAMSIASEEHVGIKSWWVPHFVMCCCLWDGNSLISSLLDAGVKHFYHFCDTSVTDFSKLYVSLKNSSNYIWREDLEEDSFHQSGAQGVQCKCHHTDSLLLLLQLKETRCNVA